MKTLKYVVLWIISFIIFMYGSFIIEELLYKGDSTSDIILLGIYLLGATIITCTYLIINTIKDTK